MKLNKDLTSMPQAAHKCLHLQEGQRFDLDLDKAHRQIASLNQKLCHARKNLEDEKRKRRSIEKCKNLLETYIHMTREILLHNEEINLNERIRDKLQFLNTLEIRHNNLCDTKKTEAQLTSMRETDSTGSILSDLNCLSKSEDDLNADIVMRTRNQIEHKEYKSSDKYSADKQCSTLDKVAEFNSPDRSASAKVIPKNYVHTVPLKTQVASTRENIDPKLSSAEASANHNFVSKLILKPETCTVCGKRIRFGKAVPKCKHCHVTCHAECKTKILPLPCTHKKSGMMCTVAK